MFFATGVVIFILGYITMLFFGEPFRDRFNKADVIGGGLITTGILTGLVSLVVAAAKYLP